MKRLFVSILALVMVACSANNVLSLQEGQCFDDEGTFKDQVAQVPIVDCDQPHDNEIYHVAEITDSDFPGSDAVEAKADSECIDAFESFVGTPYDVSELAAGWLVPTEDSWAEGDRSVVCFAYRIDLEKMNGTVEGSGL